MTLQANRPPENGLICTVTTLWDSLPNVKNFVARNLAAGVDHMFVFLDAPAPDVREYLTAVDQVTVVRTGPEFWQGLRPPRLNGRQLTNANLVNALLAPFERVQWLFSIDGDECLDIDRDELLATDPSEHPAVLLSVREVVSRAQPPRRRVDRVEPPTDQFKRIPTEDELALLALLGVIDKPDVGHYFRGYTTGKAGVHPTLDLRLGLHQVWDRTEQAVPLLTSPGWNVLHYDCWSSDEFVRKWSANATVRGAKFRGPRERLRRAAVAILDNPSTDEAHKRRLLLRLYEATTADDVEQLEEAGVLVSPLQEHHRYQPCGLGSDHDAIHRLLALFSAADKKPFWGRYDDHPGTLFQELRREEDLASDLADRLGAVLERTVTLPTGAPVAGGEA